MAAERTSGPAGFAVRRAGVADLDAIAPLFDAYRQFYSLPADPALARSYLAERLARDESLVLLASQGDGRAVGFVQMYPTYASLKAARVYVLYDLYVAPGVRRHGIGRELMLRAAAEARANGAAGLTLSTAKTNLAAQRLYESLGWKREDDFWEYALEP
jgi:ribosomal protein S18 acetylase RimI-like enzyme